jgi:hypothetical protein
MYVIWTAAGIYGGYIIPQVQLSFLGTFILFGYSYRTHRFLEDWKLRLFI